MPIGENYRFRYVLLGLDWLIPPLRRRLLRQYEAELLLSLAVPEKLKGSISAGTWESCEGGRPEALYHEAMLDELQEYRAVKTLQVPLDLFALFVMGQGHLVDRFYFQDAYGLAYWYRPEGSYPFPLSYPWRRIGWRRGERKRSAAAREQRRDDAR